MEVKNQRETREITLLNWIFILNKLFEAKLFTSSYRFFFFEIYHSPRWSQQLRTELGNDRVLSWGKCWWLLSIIGEQIKKTQKGRPLQSKENIIQFLCQRKWIHFIKKCFDVWRSLSLKHWEVSQPISCFPREKTTILICFLQKFRLLLNKTNGMCFDDGWLNEYIALCTQFAFWLRMFFNSGSGPLQSIVCAHLKW